MGTVEVQAGSRIHITLIDMNGSETGRVDGGVGLMLRDPVVVIRARPAASSSVIVSNRSGDASGDELSLSIAGLLKRLEELPRAGGAEVEIASCPPLHAGLGAKSQALLATAVAVLKSYECEIEPELVAAITGRGGTSGVGVHGFWRGGFLVDGGHPIETKRGSTSYRPSSRSASAGAATLLARYEFPDWPILIVTPHGHRIHGEWEARLFREVCPIPMSDIRAVSHTVLMHMLPAIIEGDLKAFGKSLWNIQDRRWKAFEIASQAPAVSRVMSRLRHELAVTGAGMSSWGTSIMCVDERLDGDDREGFIGDVREILKGEAADGTVLISAGLNSSALISATE